MLDVVWRDMALWQTLVTILSLLAGMATGELHAPCYACRIFNLLQRDQPDARPQLSGMCKSPCQCPIKELKCNDGVKTIKDGCGCCYMCARQHGDSCTLKDKCDEKLYCDMGNNEEEIGICKALVAKPCIINLTVYRDGEQFKPDCSQLCTCQNGNYGCVSLCPQEEKKPSERHCKNARLMDVKNRCCREWTCETDAINKTSVAEMYPYRKRENLVKHAPISPAANTSIRAPCAIKTTHWSPCSASCGVGMSVRMTNDNLECAPVQQIRLCYLRPCGKLIKNMKRKKCTPTAKSAWKHRIIFQDCRSVKDYRLKFCSTCKKNRCCYPQKTRTRTIKFECTNGKREYLMYMWIKNCQCDRVCYKSTLRN